MTETKIDWCLEHESVSKSSLEWCEHATLNGIAGECREDHRARVIHVDESEATGEVGCE